MLPTVLLDSKGFTAAATNTSARPAFTRSVNVSFFTVMKKLSPRVVVRVRRSSRMFAISRSNNSVPSPNRLMR